MSRSCPHCHARMQNGLAICQSCGRSAPGKSFSVRQNRQQPRVAGGAAGIGSRILAELLGAVKRAGGALQADWHKSFPPRQHAMQPAAQPAMQAVTGQPIRDITGSESAGAWLAGADPASVVADSKVSASPKAEVQVGDAPAAPATAIPPTSASGNLPAMAAYLVLPAVIFFFAEPYRSSSFLRFHAIQSLLFPMAVGLLAGFAMLVSTVNAFAGWLLLLVLLDACGVLLVVLAIKAYRGEMFKLPLIGDFAEQMIRTI